MSLAMHAAEGLFWWGEAYTVALPRLRALPSTLQRLRALALAVGRPPYSMISVYLLGPPVIVLLLLLAYDEYRAGRGPPAVVSGAGSSAANTVVKSKTT